MDAGLNLEGYSGDYLLTVISHYGYLTCETQTVDLRAFLPPTP